MNSKEGKKITTVVDFLAVIQELSKGSKKTFFRGQTSSEYDVSSSFYRFFKDEIENEIKEKIQFKLKNLNFLENFLKETKKWQLDTKIAKTISEINLDITMLFNEEDYNKSVDFIISFLSLKNINEKDIKEAISNIKKTYEKNYFRNKLYYSYSRNLAKKIFHEFKTNIPIYPEAKKLRDYSLNDIDVLMTAQHYGSPTRLVDWTKNPLVALYFATEIKNKENKEKVSVLILRSEEFKLILEVGSQNFIDSINFERSQLFIFHGIFKKAYEEISSNESRDEKCRDKAIESVYLDFKSAINKAINTYYNEVLKIGDHHYFINNFIEKYNIVHSGSNRGEFSEIIKRFYLKLKEEVEDIGSAGFEEMNLLGDYMYIIKPLPINPRIQNQQGVFLFSKEINKPEYGESYFKEKENIISKTSFSVNDFNGEEIVRIDIPAECAESIQKELELYGISREFIYPELETYAEEMPKRLAQDLLYELNDVSKNTFEWYKKAALEGEVDAQFNLGLMLAKGEGVKQDKKQAFKWYKKAAEQGHAKAQYSLGVMFHKGDGVPQDKKQAVEWYKKAALQGHASAQFNLGVMFYNGYGVRQNKKQAVEWYKEAALQGLAQAQYNLGLIFYNGYGVRQNKKQAVEWYKEAALQGHEDAQNTLGVMLYKGDGVPQDKKQAFEWYKKAAAQGDVNAQAALKDWFPNGKPPE